MQEQAQDLQLIFTKYGNVDVTTLDYTQEWLDHIEVDVTLVVEDGQFKPVIDKKGYMVFVEKYHDKVTKELVKENRHICLMKGFELPTSEGTLE